MKIATTTLEVENLSKDIGEAIKLYDNTGFKYLDFSFYFFAAKDHIFMSDNWKDLILSAKTAAESLGMSFVQAHAPSCGILGAAMEDSIKATARAIEACSMLGIKNMAIHTAIDEAFRYPADKLAYFEANKPFFDALIPFMEKYGVNILLENTCLVNMGGKYFPITAQDLNDMIEYLGHENFGAVWDTGHALIQGLDMCHELVELGSNLKALHIHDNPGNADYHMPLFTGKLDVENLMQGIVRSGFKGYFTYEVMRNNPSAETKKDSIIHNYKIARSILETHGMYEE